MTRKEIENTPELVDFMLDRSVIADSRMKLHKRLEELCKLAIKALEQQPCEDCISFPKDTLKKRGKDYVVYNIEWLKKHWQTELKVMGIECKDAISRNDTKIIHTDGLEEGIRCAMCTNPMANNRGCDGGCDVNESMYKRVLDVIKKNILEQYSCENVISRQAVLDEINRIGINAFVTYNDYSGLFDFVDTLPPVQPELNCFLTGYGTGIDEGILNALPKKTKEGE